MTPTSAQLSVIADQVLRTYVVNLDLIVKVLEKMGAHGIRIEGDEIRCSCPIHMGEGTDSFVVFTDLGKPIWKCWSKCGDGGLITKLVQKKYRCDYESAINFLAQEAGLQTTGDGFILVSQEALDQHSDSVLARQLGIKSIAQTPNFFPESMVEFSLQNKNDYFQKRGYPEWLLDRFQVGFVPRKTWVWDDPKHEGRQQGWFEDRVSIPWRDMEGRLVGFAGRRVDGLDYRKYLTLPGTRRALALYGLQDVETVTSIRKSRRLIVLEGYPDYWTGFMHGVYNCVCAGGTELSPEQISLIASFNLEELVFYYDGDTPGQTVARRMADQTSHIARVRMAVPPQGTDPGELFEREAFLEPIERSVPFTGRNKR